MPFLLPILNFYLNIVQCSPSSTEMNGGSILAKLLTFPEGEHRTVKSKNV